MSVGSAGARPWTGRATLPGALRARISNPPALTAALIYLGAALALFGAPLLHGGNQCICLGTDEGIPTWSFEWWPYAIAHGLNPFFTHLIYAPQGFNVAHGTTIPGLALLLTPVTLAAGPLTSYNLAMVLSPVLSAGFAFLLCRRLAGRFWPALLGGWLFGFSTYMLGQLVGHLNLTVVFLVPAIVHLVLRGLAGELTRRRFVALLALALVLQFSFTTEIFLSLTVFGFAALVAAYLWGNPELRLRLRALAVPVGVSYLLTAVIVSPYLYYALKPGGVPVLPGRDDYFSSDLLSFMIPSPITEIGGIHFLPVSRTFRAGFVEGGIYLGLPLLAMLALAVRRGWRRMEVRILASTGLVVAVASLGGHLQLLGETGLPLPWWPVTHLPLLGLMLPVRFVLYVVLAAALLAAWWLTVSPHRTGAWLLALLSVACLWPATGRGFWKDSPEIPPLFTSAAFRGAIGPQDTALLLPVGGGGLSMLWQAEAHLRFRMASGYLVPPEAPDPYKTEPIYPTLTTGAVVPDVQRAAASFLTTHHITVAVVDTKVPGTAPWIGILERLGWQPRTLGGAILLRRPRTA